MRQLGISFVVFSMLWSLLGCADPCDPSPCQNNGTCTADTDKALCDCTDTGFKGDTCETDVDECAADPSPCTENSTCSNTVGGYNCPCDSGYEANADAGTCVDVDECSNGNATCTANSTCSNTVGGYNCPCDSGYEANADAGTCADVDECAADTSVCDPNAACTNTVGSFSCLCNSGWQGDGALCSDVDECQENPCDEHALCTNTDGAYECVCNEGWEGDGLVCVPICGDGVCNEDESCQTCGEDCSTGGASEDTTSLDEQEQAFLVIINEYRAQNALGALAACRSLNRTAQGHSEDMRDQGYFSHEGLNGSTPWSRACDACYELGCGPQTAMSENLAAGNADAQGTFTQWKNSPGHNQNMLSPNVNYIGIGRATGGGTFGVYWTNVFGGAFEQSCE